MSAYGKSDYAAFNAARIRAFGLIARGLGEKHEITKRMGSLAWGRHNAEQGVETSLRSECEEFGYLNGYFDSLNLWARDNDQKAQSIMLAHWPQGYRNTPL